MRLTAPAVRHAVQQYLFNSVSNLLSLAFSPGKTDKYLLRSIILAAYNLTFKPRGFFILWRIARIFFDSKLTGGKNVTKPKIMGLKFTEVVLPA